MPLNVPIGHGHDFKRRGQHAEGAGRSPTARCSIRSRSSDTLIESIIEVDEEVTERYFEGTLPTDEEIAALDRRGRRDGQR